MLLLLNLKNVYVRIEFKIEKFANFFFTENINGCKIYNIVIV